MAAEQRCGLKPFPRMCYTIDFFGAEVRSLPVCIPPENDLVREGFQKANDEGVAENAGGAWGFPLENGSDFFRR